MDIEALRRFRAMKDDFLGTDPSSPLTPRQRERFGGLAYFPPNPELALEAEIHPYLTPDDVDLVTSCGDTERYGRAGVLWFEVDGVPSTITLFRSDRGDLFVPFRDATSGSETYGAGRYLEARSIGDGRTLLDFNYAYNPYCAYSTGGGARSPRSRTTLPSRSAPASGAIRPWSRPRPIRSPDALGNRAPASASTRRKGASRRQIGEEVAWDRARPPA